MSTKNTPAKPEDKDKDEGSLASQATAAVVEQTAAAQKAAQAADVAKAADEAYAANKAPAAGAAGAVERPRVKVKVGQYVRSQIGDVYDPLTNLKYTSSITEVLKASAWLDKQVSVGKFVIDER